MLLGNRTLSQEQTQIRRHFIDFFEADRMEEKYNRRIHAMMADGKSRLIIDMNDLLDFVPLTSDTQESLGVGVMRAPGQFVPLCELAVHDIVLRFQPDYLKVDYRSKAVHVGFEGPVGTVLGPRELYARHLNTLVALEGIVTRQSALRPRVLETVHYCPDTNKFSKKEYRDQLTPMLDSAHLPTVNVMPKTDLEGHLLRTELGLSSFVDSQCAILQELPERAPTGQLPRNVELRLDDDLVDGMKPGDRVMVVGIYVPYTAQDSKSFQSIVLVNNIVPSGALGRRVPRLLESFQDEMRKFCEKCVAEGGPTGVLDTLSKAVAPAIFGLTPEKQAILLMMIGGVERTAHNSHIRGDINILLVGEPSTAKSQLLRFVLGVSPLALSTTGKGSSGVGLTAAVTVDQYSGERALSAGAMVLADRGILCVDEFDKMSPQDRVAMHEAMEQQTVTITKAGIHASLNARCSVLAAANPIYGFYSVRHRLAFNVGLPESLLSRFDLIFIILDQKHSSEYNRRIGNHILRNHMTSEPALFDDLTTKTIVSRDDAAGRAAGQPHDPVAAAQTRVITNCTGETVMSPDFLRRYVLYAKSMTPLLNEASQRMISDHYVQLRAEQQDPASSKDGFFVTARTLESIVRLATAHAKLRLSPVVDEDDVKVAMTLLRASVHAASDASAQRERQRAAAPAANDDEPARKQARGEAAAAAAPGAAAGPAADVGGAADLQRAVLDALAGFQRERRSQVHLHEVRDRVMQARRGADVDVLALQRSLSQLQNDSYTYESTDTEEVVYFH